MPLPPHGPLFCFLAAPEKPEPPRNGMTDSAMKNRALLCFEVPAASGHGVMTAHAKRANTAHQFNWRAHASVVVLVVVMVQLFPQVVVLSGGGSALHDMRWYLRENELSLIHI